MKKLFASYIAVSIILSILIFSSFAHPGRTDSNGGHYNHDTGEYHYHSGEYAGREQTSSGSSDSVDWDYEIKRRQKIIVQNNAEFEGKIQKLKDTLYKKGYEVGFNAAMWDYGSVRPFFVILFAGEPQALFTIDFSEYDSYYNDVRKESFNNLLSLNPEYSLYEDIYNYYYDYGYNNHDVDEITNNTDVDNLYDNAFEEGQAFFYDECLDGFKEDSLLKYFIASLTLTQFIILFTVLLSLLIISIILLFILFSKHRKVKKSVVVSPETTDIPNISSEPITENIINDKSTYKSLIPEFIPPELNSTSVINQEPNDTISNQESAQPRKRRKSIYIVLIILLFISTNVFMGFMKTANIILGGLPTAIIYGIMFAGIGFFIKKYKNEKE